MCQRKPPCTCLFRNGYRHLRVQVRPPRALIAGLQATLGDQQVGVPGKGHRIIADSCIRAVADNFAIELQPVPKAGCRVDEREAGDREGEVVRSRNEFANFIFEREFPERHCVGLVDKRLKNPLRPCLGEDFQPLTEPELAERMQAGDMIDMHVAEEEEYRFALRDIPVCLREAIAGVEDDIVVLRLHEDRDGVAGHAVVPAVGAKERHLHVYRIGVIP